MNSLIIAAYVMDILDRLRVLWMGYNYFYTDTYINKEILMSLYTDIS